MNYAELEVTTNFSFLEGGSHPEELVQTAARLGLRAIAITDRNTLAGIVRAHGAAQEAGVQLIIGARLTFIGDGAKAETLLAYPVNRQGYANLCRLITCGRRRADKNNCLLYVEDILEFQEGLIFVSKITSPPLLELLRGELKNLSVAISRTYQHNSKFKDLKTIELARKFKIPLVATNDVLYHLPTRRPLQDVLTCIREHCTLTTAGFRLAANAERYLKPPAEMQRLFRDIPEAIARSLEIAEMTKDFNLSQLRYEYPDAICPNGKDPKTYLAELCQQESWSRYPQGVPPKVSALIEQELALISELEYEKYFLTCYDIVKEARRMGILCQGRGAAANSAVCFVLGITSVDPDRIETLFARFISKERKEPPDIDIDFEHERREEIIQYIYRTYGREHAGLAAEVITYQARSAVREVAKAFGLSLETTDRLAKSIHRWTGSRLTDADLTELGLSPHDLAIRQTVQLSQELKNFPRHLSQHVGGFIISGPPLCEIVPIINAGMVDRTIIEWDKDDIDALGMLKIDCLGLGMLSCIRRALDFVNHRRSDPVMLPLTLATIPAEDPKVYDMICNADTVGIFQIESRAQMSMLPRLKPRCFYDLVIEVAIVRPGPIQGNMVHPYLKRRAGLEQPFYPDDRVKAVLGKTLGVPLFQEQAMRLVMILADFTPGEAEKLRRAIQAWRRHDGLINSFRERVLVGMMRKGYPLQFAEACFNQIRGFSEYGFPESHAASFALLVYASAWLKCHHPAAFAAALINSQPMGFYASSQIVRDVEQHSISVLPVHINKSSWDCSLEDRGIRLGFRLVRGLREQEGKSVAQLIQSGGPVSSVEELWQRCHRRDIDVRIATLQALAEADAFQSLGLSRREALWAVKALPKKLKPLDRPQTKATGQLPRMSEQQEMFADYQTLGLSLKAHPVSFIRSELDTLKVSTARELKDRPLKTYKNFVSVAGLAIFRQRPGTAKGVVFLTLEDETGITNLIIKPQVFETHQKIIVGSSCLLAHGILERTGEVVYVSAQSLKSLDEQILKLREESGVNLESRDLPLRSYSY